MQRYNATVEGGSGVPVISSHWDIPDEAGMFNTEKEQNYSTNTEFFPNQLSLERRLRHCLHNPFYLLN